MKPFLFLPNTNRKSWLMFLKRFLRKELRMLSCTTEYTDGMISFTRSSTISLFDAKLNILQVWLFIDAMLPSDDSVREIAITACSVSELTA
jgi:hypothetical protein